MLEQTIGTYQFYDPFEGYRVYAREALKAFKRVTVRGEVYYTCNVTRLRDCDRLGNDAVIPLWRTHFFLRSRHFDEAVGVIFSSRPGIALAEFSSMAVDARYIFMGEREILDPTNGARISLEEDLPFASDIEQENEA